ncbi:MAG: tetratricopeptide repeat protein, partial [Acidobacteriota bacterium]
EGLYMQSSVSSPFVFHLQSELTRKPSCPFSQYYYSGFNLERAAKHLKLFNATQLVTTTAETAQALDRSPEFRLEAEFSPFRIYRLSDFAPSYVAPLERTPFRMERNDWKRVQYDWFRLASLDTPLVVAPSSNTGEYWKSLPRWNGSFEGEGEPLADDVQATATLGRDRIEVITSRAGHPLWIKVSYHPDWKIEEGEGELYQASPAFMLLVPRTERVVLRFDTRGGVYALGLGLTGLTLLAGVALWRYGPWRIDAAHAAMRIHPALWAVVALAALAPLFGRSERDPILFYEKAAGVYQQAEQALSSGPDGSAQGSRLLAEARDLFTRCLEKYPFTSVSDHVARSLALIHMREGKWQEAIDLYTSYLATHPESGIYPEALFELGLSARSLGDSNASNEYFWRLVTWFPDSAPATEGATRLLGSHSAEALLETARLYYKNEDYIRAYPLLDALSRDKESPFHAESLLMLARAEFRLNRWPEAARRFTEWLKIHPAHARAAEAWFDLGQCYMFLKDYETARYCFQGAVAIDPAMAQNQPYRAIMKTVEDLLSKGSQ